MDTIEGMKTFLAVANKQSFTGGAKVLGVSTKLASKYVAQLEAKLGARLLHRTTRSVTLTQTGAAYYDRCLTIVDQINELEDVIQQRQSELAGPIRITGTTAFGSLQLVEALKPFQRAHPRVSIDLHLSDHRVAIVEEGFDLAIRFGKLSDSTLIARKLIDMRMVVFASPEYLEREGEPSQPSALATHNCLILKVTDNPFQWPFEVNGKAILVDVAGSFEVNSPRALVNMAVGGTGIGRAPKYVVEPYLKEGSLTLLFEEYEISPSALYAVYPSNRHLTARIRTLIDHLVNVFSEDA